MSSGRGMSDFDLDSFLPYRLAVAAGRVSRAFADRYRREFGISIPEWRVLAHLAQEGAISVREIHARLEMDKSKVSRAASRLVAAGLVIKRNNDKDGRLVALELTDGGRTLFARISLVAEDYQAELLSRLGPDAESLMRALDRIGDQPKA